MISLIFSAPFGSTSTIRRKALPVLCIRSSAAPKDSISCPTRWLLRDSVPIALDAIGIVVLVTASPSSINTPPPATRSAAIFTAPRFVDFALAIGMAFFSRRPNIGRGASIVKFVKFVNSDGPSMHAGEEIEDYPARPIEALACIGGPDASRSVGHLMAKGIVQGPTLAVAATAASELGVIFPPDVALMLLRHSNPAVRATACGCVRAGRDIVATLIELLLGDLDSEVSTAAACALGRMGRAEARDHLKRLLKDRPSPRVLEAVAGVADEEVVIFLVRIRTRSPRSRRFNSLRARRRRPSEGSRCGDRAENKRDRHAPSYPSTGCVPATSFRPRSSGTPFGSMCVSRSVIATSRICSRSADWMPPTKRCGDGY